MKVLKELPEEDLTFIVLKYKEDYSDEELSNYFNLTLDEIKEKDLRIIDLLRNNESVKLLVKNTNNWFIYVIIFLGVITCTIK